MGAWTAIRHIKNWLKFSIFETTAMDILGPCGSLQILSFFKSAIAVGRLFIIMSASNTMARTPTVPLIAHKVSFRVAGFRTWDFVLDGCPYLASRNFPCGPIKAQAKSGTVRAVFGPAVFL